MATILNFRHLLEAKDMGAELLRLVNVYLAENGLTAHHECTQYNEEPGEGA